MSADATAADHVERFVAGAAGRGVLLFEVVGLVTAGARCVAAVAAFVERGGRNERLLFRVALAAGAERWTAMTGGTPELASRLGTA